MNSNDPPTERAFLYVLCVGGSDDLLKIGVSANPMKRWSFFHPRWFEVFDLDHSCLVETQSRTEAQQLESQLHHSLQAHRCPVPVAMRGHAGGGAEWYRGAYPTLRRFCAELKGQGFVVHETAKPFMAQALLDQQSFVLGMLYQAHADHQSGWLSVERKRSLQDLVDAHRALTLDASCALPTDLLGDMGLCQ